MKPKVNNGKVIAFINQKGGVAKTTSAWNFGVELGIRGFKVCLLDMDPQGSLTYFALNGEDLSPQKKTVMEWLGLKDDPATFADVVIRDVQNNISVPANAKTITGKLDLIPADIRFSTAERLMVGKMAPEKLLSKRVREIKEQYDYIVIDAPPSLGYITINILMATDEIIIPTKPELASAEGMTLLFGTMGELGENYDKEFEVGGILLTMVKARTTGYKQVREALEALGKDLEIKVYDTVIRDSVVASDAAGSGLSISQYNKTSPVGIDYITWVDEYLNKEGVTSGNK